RDIDGGTNIARKYAIRCEPRDALVDNPSVLAIRAAEPVFHLKWLPRIEGPGVCSKAFLQIVRMNPGSPAIAKFFLDPAPRLSEPVFVEARAKRVPAGDP